MSPEILAGMTDEQFAGYRAGLIDEMGESGLTGDTACRLEMVTTEARRRARQEEQS